MKITPIDLQANWLAFYEQRIIGMIRTAYPGTGEHLRKEGESLAQWVSRLTGHQGADLYILMSRLPVQQSQEPSNKLGIAWQAFLNELNNEQDAPRQKEDDASEFAPILDNEVSDDAYERGFSHFQAKREAAKKNRLKWYLEYQKELLLKLRRQAWFGKLSAILYGTAVGIGLAGYMAVTITFAVITQNWWLLSVPVLLAWFPLQTNFWITRKAPSELIFDLFTSPRDPTEKGSKAKEWTARILGLCNALIYGGLTAYGMYEFFMVIGAMGTFAGAALSGVAIVSLGLMVFLPELGMGIKFIRQNLDKGPITRYNEMCAKVQHQGQYKAKFFGVFACAIVGGVFTTLAAASMVAMLTGLPLFGAQIFLSLFTLTILPFYYDKALKYATSSYMADNSIEAPKAQTSYSVAMRIGNALVNAVPAFLGGLIFAGAGGYVFAVFTGITGLVASYLSAEDGAQPGYEKEIETELKATEHALQEIGSSNPGEPEIEGLKATRHPVFFRPFNATRETRQAELELLSLNPPSLKLKAS